MYADHVVLSDGSRIDTQTVARVTGVTGVPLIDKLGLPEKGRFTVQADLQLPKHLNGYAADAPAADPASLATVLT